MAVGLVFDESERPGTDDVDLVGRLGRFLCRIDRNRRARRGEVIEESRLHVLQRHRHLIGAGLGHLVDGAQQRRGCADFAVALQRGDDVFGVEFLPVVEFNPLADRKHVGLPVLRDFDVFGQLRNGLRILVAGVERLVNLQVDVARRLRGGHLRIERRRRLRDRNDHIAALGLRESAARGR